MTTGKLRQRFIAFGALAVIAAGIVALVWINRKEQTQPTVAIFNLVSHPILDASVKGIKAELADRGYSGDAVRYVEINANGEMDKLNAFAVELVNSRPTVIVPVSTPVTQAVAKVATEKDRIVFSTVTNASDVGMDQKPANMTGVCDVVNYEANLSLIRELFPSARKLGIIYNASERNSQFGVGEVERLAPHHNFELVLVSVARSDEVADAARSLVDSVDVFYVGSDNTVVTAIAGLTKVASEGRKPVIASDSGSVEEGALAAVSVDYEKLGRRAGAIIADVLANEKKPGEIGLVKFVGDSLIVNEKSAEKIGFSFPASVQKRASRTIKK